MPDVPEHEIARHWKRVERSLCEHGLLTDPVQRLLTELRSRVVSRRREGVKGFSLNLSESDFDYMVTVAASVPSEQRKAIPRVLGKQAVGQFIALLNNRRQLQSDIEDTRVLFGLTAPATAEFHTQAAHLSDRLCGLEVAMKLLRKCSQEAPPRVRELTKTLPLGDACRADADALEFVDGMAKAIEEAATELLPMLRQCLYVPDRSSDEVQSPSADRELCEEEDLRDFLHWLCLVLHRFRWELILQFKKTTLYKIAEVAGELLEHTLFECGWVLFLKRRFPIMLAETPQSVADPEQDAANKAEFVRIAKEKMTQFENIDNIFDVLLGQWRRLSGQQQSWKTGDLKKTREHLAAMRRTLHNLRNLDLHANQTKFDDDCRIAHSRTSLLPRPYAKHTVIFSNEEGEPLELWMSVHAPSFTNMVTAFNQMYGSRQLPPCNIFLHHATGQACLSALCLVPLASLVHPECRLAQLAGWLGRHADWALRDWEIAASQCELGNALAALRHQPQPVHLISHRHHEVEGDLSHFVFVEKDVHGLIDPDNLAPLPVQARNYYQKLKIPLPEGQLVALMWNLPEIEDLDFGD